MASNWRNTRDYRIWRVGVIRRDKACQLCGSRDKRHAHHLNHSTYFIDERFNTENGICLCSKCHSHFHNDYKSSTREKCTLHDYEEYSKLADYFFEVTLTRLFKDNLIKEELVPAISEKEKWENWKLRKENLNAL